MKLGYKDKPFITAELKSIHRKKNREYLKRGKTPKYVTLRKQFDKLYKDEASKYLEGTLNELRNSYPGQASSILKRLGAPPNEQETNNFSLPTHSAENLSSEQSAERIASHFASISQEFTPLDTSQLPARVQNKLKSTECPPEVSEYETFLTIRSAKKPKSSVQHDLPRKVTMEFAPELALPVTRIINNILKSGIWPSQWKLEEVVPIPKITYPQSEDDLRPISLTPIFSKVTEHLVVKWLMEYIGSKIDVRQFGGLKGNSITHYLIELTNFILLQQDSSDQIAILACLVDFSKAFNRQNHAILVTKLSDLGVPAWLLRIVMAFLSDRKMSVRFNGKLSSIKNLPGGGPQGTVLALLLFLVLINEVGFDGQTNTTGTWLSRPIRRNMPKEMHLKFVDDLTLLEALKLPDQLTQKPSNIHQEPEYLLQASNSRIYSQLQKTSQYASENDMKINHLKTKLMCFNPCKSIQFSTEITLDDNTLEVVTETKLLGLILRSDLKWSSNTTNMVRNANKCLWLLRRLRNLGTPTTDLVQVYTRQIRSKLELAVPVWACSLTQSDSRDIERVQRTACCIILGDQFETYSKALITLDLETLEARRLRLSLNFALKAEKSDKFRNWFTPSVKRANTRQQKDKYCQVWAKHNRMEKSPIAFLTNLLNAYYRMK